jgi:hypothetical protein
MHDGIDSLLILNSLTTGAKPLTFDVQVSLARSFLGSCHQLPRDFRVSLLRS